MTLARWCRLNDVEMDSRLVVAHASRRIGTICKSRGIETRLRGRDGFRRKLYPDTLLDELAADIRQWMA